MVTSATPSGARTARRCSATASRCRPGPAREPDETRDLVNWSFDVRTGRVRRLSLPGNGSVLDRAADGKAYLVIRYGGASGAPGGVQGGAAARGRGHAGGPDQAGGVDARRLPAVAGGAVRPGHALIGSSAGSWC